MVTSTIEAPCYHVNKGISNKRDFVFEDFQLSIDTANKKKKKQKPKHYIFAMATSLSSQDA